MSLTLFTLCIFLITPRVAGTSTWIGLYQDAHFSGLVLSLRDIKTQTCYNLLCDGVNNVISSATWLGWTPTTADGTLPIIKFFMDKDCKGTLRGYKATGDDYPSSFTQDGMGSKITSMIVYARNAVDVDKTVTFCEGNTERATINASNGEFSGQINLYRDTNFRHNLALFTFTRSNRCFNLDCGDYNNAVSSVDWSGLPTSASYDGQTKAHIVFYADTDCTGTSKSFSTAWNRVSSFVDYDINDVVSSFMVLETSDEIENGKTTICSNSRALRASVNATA